MRCWRPIQGKDLEYKEYEPLFRLRVKTCEKQHKKAFYVTCDNYVTLTDGTGVVHIAPAFGEDDAKVGRRYDMPFRTAGRRKRGNDRGDSVCRCICARKRIRWS